MTLFDITSYYHDMIDYMITVILSIISEARRYKIAEATPYRDMK